MSQPTSHTTNNDAPLSAAKHPDTSTLDADRPEERELIGRTITINLPRSEVYAFWRNLTNLARFMENVLNVAMLDERRSHWVVAAPGNATVEWNSVILEDRPFELISWQSEEGSDITHSGRIEFREAQGGRGTEVTATISYDPPGGAVGKLVAKLFQEEPKIQSRRDLRRLKQLLETGEISTSVRSLAEAEKKTVGASLPVAH